jgi:uncharacterized repeat protein (TIGR01451 family)
MCYKLSRFDRTYVPADNTNRGCVEIFGTTTDTVGQYRMKVYVQLITSLVSGSYEAATIPGLGSSFDITFRVKDSFSTCIPFDSAIVSKISPCPTPDCTSNYIYIVRGGVYADINHNCILEPSIDRPIKDKILIDKYSTSRTISNDFGQYLIYSYDTAKIYISNLNDHSIDCVVDDSISLNITSITRDTSGINFLLSGDDCYRNNIEIGMGLLAPCRYTDFGIIYSNTGFDTSYSSYILVEVDTSLFDSITADIPFILSGDTLRFNIGNIPPLSYNSFNINAHLKCSSIIGTSSCVRTYIYPLSNCPPTTSTYDSSDVEIMTTCNNDTVYVELKNKSAHNMSAPGRVIYLEDDTIQEIDSFSIAASLSTNKQYYVNSNLTFTLKVEQHPQHPYRPILIMHDELCALSAPIKLNTVIDHFYRYDDAAAYDEACIRILASFDPNIKSVIPVGISPLHYTDSNQILEYRIDFQNTGLAAAEKIVVEDSISTWLDLNSFVPLTSSHKYSVDIIGPNIIHFVFDSIMLPDSNSNEPASHGYVIFKIRPKFNTPKGTIINNFADIFFDFNAPVRTNTVFNMIFDTVFVRLGLGLNEPKENLEAHVLVFPNPAVDKFIIKLDKDLQNAQIKLLDINGREVYQLSNVNGKSVEITNIELSKGIYFVNIFDKNKLIGKSKIIIQ